MVSSGSESVVTKLESMQSKAARYVLGRSRKEWSRSGGYEELNWSTMPQIAVESSLNMYVLQNSLAEEAFETVQKYFL